MADILVRWLTAISAPRSSTRTSRSPNSSGRAFRSPCEIGVVALAPGAGCSEFPRAFSRRLHHNSAADYATMTLAVIGIAIPSFVVLPFSGLLFGIYLHWLPVAGWEPGSRPPSGAAGDRAVSAAAGVHRANDPRQHARGTAQRFHPHGVRQGPAAARGDPAARAAARARCRSRAILLPPWLPS